MANAASTIDGIRLDGKVAIVTGGGGGMGKVMARALAKAGASVAIVDVDSGKIADAVTELGNESGHGTIIGHVADITRERDCLRTVQDTVDAFGKLDILINNAALAPRHVDSGPRTTSRNFWEADPDAWQRLIVTNVNGTFLMSSAATPELIKGGWGRLINITTGLDVFQRPFSSPYGVSKAAIESMTVIWAQDLAGTGVTVNSLHPGSTVDTDFLTDQSKEKIRNSPKVLLDADVMAAPIVWMCSTQADGVNGARFAGWSWDPKLPPDEAAKAAREPSIFVPY